MFYWLPNPNMNVLLLSNLRLVYSMNWKESVVFPEEIIVLLHSSWSLVLVVFTILRHQMMFFITYSSTYCGEMSLLLSEIKFYLYLDIKAPSSTSKLKLHANARSIFLYRNYMRRAFSFWILDCPKHLRREVQNQSSWSVWLLVACLSRTLYLSVRQEGMQLSTNNVIVKFW